MADLDSSQRALLDIVSDAFIQHSVWPFYQYVSTTLRNKLGCDPHKVYLSMPPDLLQPASDPSRAWILAPDTKVSLTIRGLNGCQGGGEDLDRFVRALALIAAKGAAFRPEPTEVRALEVTSDEISTLLGVEQTSSELRRVFLLLRDGVREIWTGASGPSSEGHWLFTINLDHVGSYAGVASVDDFLERRRPFERAQLARLRTTRPAQGQTAPILFLSDRIGTPRVTAFDLVAPQSKVPSLEELHRARAILVVGDLIDGDPAIQLGGFLRQALEGGALVLFAYLARFSAVDSRFVEQILGRLPVEQVSGSIGPALAKPPPDPDFAAYVRLYGRSDMVFPALPPGAEPLAFAEVRGQPMPSAFWVRIGTGVIYVVPYHLADGVGAFLECVCESLVSHAQRIGSGALLASEGGDGASPRSDRGAGRKRPPSGSRKRPDGPPPEMAAARSRLQVIRETVESTRAALGALLKVSVIAERYSRDSGIVTADPWRWSPLESGNSPLLGVARRQVDELLELIELTLNFVGPEHITTFREHAARLRTFVVRAGRSPGPPAGSVETAAPYAWQALDGLWDIIEQVPAAHEPPDVLVIPDTNALLADPEIEEWALGPEALTIVIVPDVLRELDAKKLDNQLAPKATSVIRRFKEYSRRGDTLHGVPLVGRRRFREIARAADMKLAASWLDPDNADDRILAGALQLAVQHLSCPILLVTRDRNLQNKARSLDLPAIDVADL